MVWLYVVGGIVCVAIIAYFMLDPEVINLKRFRPGARVTTHKGKPA